VFGGANYYPSGGADDFLGFAETMMGAIGLIRGMEYLDVSGSWAQICNEKMEVLELWTHPGKDRDPDEWEKR
jgi:hypothetical protein